MIDVGPRAYHCALMSHADRLINAARAVSQLRARIAADPVVGARCVQVKHWQSARLAGTHEDLLGEPRHIAAARFFLDDLYGAKDFSRRDAEFERVVPVLARMLPDPALQTLADAVELDALSEDLDFELARALEEAGATVIDEASYALAYRSSAAPDERERQLDLVLTIGRSLDRLVRMPMLGALLAAMGRPARAAGFSEIHDFLLRGFGAFKSIGGASEFLGRIDRRERLIMRRLYAGTTAGWTSQPGC